MSAITMPGFNSSASIAFDGASSCSRSARSSHPAPPTPITGANTRPLTGWRRSTFALWAPAYAVRFDANVSKTTAKTTNTRGNIRAIPLLMTLAARPASPDDAPMIAQIYNEGIEDRVGTFETQPRTVQDVLAWFDGVHPIVVVEADGEGVIAFASTSSYRSRACYAGIAEFSVYVARQARGRGAGSVAMRALLEAVKPAGIWKLVSRIFVENDASRRLMASMGFREVGIYEKHAKLDGQWRDVVIVERLIPENQG